MNRIAFALLVALVGLSAPRVALSQGEPLGPEFVVNTHTTGSQEAPAVAVDSSGNFIVVWMSLGQDGGGIAGVFGQRYDSSGAALGPEFQVNTYTTGNQIAPAVAWQGSGSFVVVWASDGQDGSGLGVFAQRYASSGAPLGPEFRVNTYTSNDQTDPAVAADSSGNFVVVWTSGLQDGSLLGVFGQRYGSSGSPLGAEFRVNTFTTNTQWLPSVASDAAGAFVVVWESNLQDGSDLGVFGQRFAAGGAALGSEFRINTFTTAGQSYPSVAADSSGNFVVVWDSFGQDGSNRAVIGQRYSSSGPPLGSEFLVNTYTTGYQVAPSVAADGAGNFVVAWQSNPEDGDGYGIFGQRYDDTGAALGPEFRVNTYTTYGQSLASVGADPSGDFVVVWKSLGRDGDSYAVVGQRYGQIVPVRLTGFTVE
jgi:hypothetical protein